MPVIRDIPGFYYDESKNKYFRIQPGHRAPQKARYTYDNVKDEAAAVEQRRKIAEDKARSLRVRGILSDTMMNPLMGGMYRLGFGLGGLKDRKRILAQCFATNMNFQTTMKGAQGFEIQKFCMNERTGHMLLGMKAPTGKTGLWLSTDPPWDSINSTDTPGPLIGMDNPAFFAKSDITSTNTGYTGTMIATTLGGADRAEIHLMANLSDTSTHVVLLPGGEQSVRTSAASKFDGTLAAGLDKSVIVIKEAQVSWTERSFPVPSNAFAIEFLNRDTLMYGCRNGGVQIFDLRTNIADGINFRHSSTVTHIRRVDENRLIVNGLQNSLSMYDLRHIHIVSVGPKITGDSRNSNFRSAKVNPVVTYDYCNEYHLGLGFDIDPEHGVVAAAQSDGTVQFFCLNAGKKLSQIEFQNKVSCMQFVRFQDGCTRLLVSAKNEIRGYEP